MRKSLILSALVACLSAWTVWAQTDGTYVGYSPYSVYGVGNLHRDGAAWNRGMGGVGTATRNKRFVNMTNPASITARDSLSFMSDFGLSGKMSIFTDGDKNGVGTTMNIDNFVISFPLWRHTAFMAGITPYSDVGYDISYSKIDYYSYQQTFSSSGNGGMYQMFAATAVTLWNRLSLGVQGNYLFGSINKVASNVNSDTSYQDFSAGDSLQVRSLNAKFGLQYEQPFSGGYAVTLGATYKMSSPISGHRISYLNKGSYSRERTENSISDDNVFLGDEIGVGLNFRNSDIWSFEVNYLRGDWTGSGFEKISGFSNQGEEGTFASDVSQSFRAGFEITPSRNDIRYFLKRCTYRTGAYFDQSYYTVNGQHVNSVGITLGMTIPVFRWYNGLSLGLDFGQRGLSGAQIKENYFNFSVGLNMFDIWFRKPRYE